MRQAFLVYAVLAAIFAGGCEILYASLKYGIAGGYRFGAADVFILVALCANLLMTGIVGSRRHGSGTLLVIVALGYAAVEAVLVFGLPDADLRDFSAILVAAVGLKVAAAVALGVSLARQQTPPGQTPA